MFGGDGLPSKKIEIDTVRIVALQQGEANECHPEGSRHL